MTVANTSYTPGNTVNIYLGSGAPRLRVRGNVNQPALPTARLRDERGFTLIELLVALRAGAVISTATLEIVIISLHLSSNYTDRIDANQQGRIAMERITQALTVGCVDARPVPPVVAGSTATQSSSTATSRRRATIQPNLVTIPLAARGPRR